MKNRRNIWLKIITGVLVAGPMVFFQNLHAQDSAETAKAAIELSFSAEDSVKQVKATVTRTNADGQTIPAAEVEVYVYAKKSFGLLPLGDPQTTDENGEVSFEFPGDLPGDASGTITVVAKFEEHEELGSMETSAKVKWGIPTVVDNDINKRALWASGGNAPLALVITVTGMVVGVWAVIIYILVILIQIKKSAIYETTKQN